MPADTGRCPPMLRLGVVSCVREAMRRYTGPASWWVEGGVRGLVEGERSVIPPTLPGRLPGGEEAPLASSTAPGPAGSPLKESCLPPGPWSGGVPDLLPPATRPRAPRGLGLALALRR